MDTFTKVEHFGLKAIIEAFVGIFDFSLNIS